MNTIAETLAQIKAQLTGPGAPFELIDVDVDGRRLPAYRNARETIPDMINAARVHGDKTYIVYEGYGRLRRLPDQLPWWPMRFPSWQTRLPIWRWSDGTRWCS